MLPTNLVQSPEVNEQIIPLSTFPRAVEARIEPEITELLDSLSPENPWGERQYAARNLGFRRCQAAVPALLATLPADPFWMVRCAIIQALEMIGDPASVPSLEQVAINDSFQVVRAYAAKAVERLS
ncbi:MAG: HEAT repeat domain-containing protein [Chloroflexota bacterium]